MQLASLKSVCGIVQVFQLRCDYVVVFSVRVVMWLCMSVYVSVYLCVCVSVCLSVCLSLCVRVCVSVCECTLV